MVYKKGGKREIAPEYNNKIRWSIYQKAVKRFSIYLLMLEIESKRCNPKDVILVSSRKSYGDVKAIAFSFGDKNLLVYRQGGFCAGRLT